jgi:hypothetical protein
MYDILAQNTWTHEKNNFHMISIIKLCDGKFVMWFLILGFILKLKFESNPIYAQYLTKQRKFVHFHNQQYVFKIMF